MRIFGVLCALVFAGVTPAAATVMTFENFDDGAVIVDSYGDLIGSNNVRGFPYRIKAEGTTPNVFVGFEDNLRVNNGVFGTNNGAASAADGDDSFSFGFTGLQTSTLVDVRLHDFVLYSKSGVLENVIIEVYDHTRDEIFRGVYSVTESGTKISFAKGMDMFLTGRVLDVTIRTAGQNAAGSLAIDDIRFSQALPSSVSTPLPGAALFMGTGLAAIIARRRRRIN